MANNSTDFDLDNDSFDQDIIINMVNLCIDDGNLDLAIACLKHGLHTYPDFIEFYNLLGYVFTQQEEYSEALKFLSYAESKINENDKHDPDHEDFLILKIETIINLAICHKKMKDLDKALSYFHTILMEYEYFQEYCIALALYERAGIYVEKSEFRLAEKDLAKSSEILSAYQTSDKYLDHGGQTLDHKILSLRINCAKNLI
jgi:tetratricopeptide (TPR) repeat protein